VKVPDSGLVSRLSASLDIARPTAACLVNRGLSDPQAAAAFLDPRLGELLVPKDMADLAKAADRVAEAVSSRERVGVFGDYDVDGVTSAALVTLFLRQVGVETEPFLADRFSGYGLTPAVIEDMVSRGCTLAISLDCGTSDHEAARTASAAGIDLLVVDHHRIEGPHPAVYAFVNPQRSDCRFGDCALAAVGLAFYFVGAIRSALHTRGLIRREDLDLRPFLELVALGTVADVMPMRGNNRILVQHGLRQMSRTPSEGIQALLRVAKIRAARLRADHIAFQLAPRLNAAGRVSHARDAFELLVSRGRTEAEELAARLDGLSTDRRALETVVLEQAREFIEQRKLENRRVIVVSGEGWHRGVLGIVASRLVEGFSRPVCVVSFDGDEGTGSARGQGQVNLHQMLACASSVLTRFGGHRDAAGFSVRRHELDRFEALVADYSAQHWSDVSAEPLECETRLGASELCAGLVEQLERIGPFGSGNPEPAFEIDGLYVLEKRIVGREHLKLKLKTPSGTLSAFGPRLASIMSDIPPLVRLAATLSVDEWRADGFPELRLVAPPAAGL
jgi:single-stranded-DNA-specific exonuclease